MEQKLTAPPRVVFLSSGGLLGDTVLRRLLASNRLSVVGIVRSRRVMLRKAGFLRGAIAYFSRCGVLYTVYIWTITTFAEFLGLFTGVGSITSRARKQRIPVHHTRDINDSRGLAFIEACEPDILLSAHFDQKLYPPLCHSSRWTGINVHPSLLPEHRGLEPVLHSMLSDNPTFGVSIHHTAEEIDEGKVVAQSPHSPQSKDSVLRVTRDLMAIGAELFVESLNPAAKMSATSSQNIPTYHSWPTGREVKKLHRKGRWIAGPRDINLFWDKG